MRIAHVLTLIGAAALSLSAAAEPANIDSTASSMATVNVTRMRSSDVKAVLGTYALEDGRTLRVSTEQRKLYAELDGAKKEIFKVDDAKFASRDDALRVSFDAGSVSSAVTVSTLAAR
jgi:hypothetical protein